MSSEHDEMSERERRLREVLVAYLEAAEAGRAPDRQQWLAHHSEFAAELEEFLAGRAHLERLAGPLRPPPRAAGEGSATPAEGPEQAASPPGATGAWAADAAAAALAPTLASGPPATPAPPVGSRVGYVGDY